tara:strand:- start:269 stop:370 length:102 start_codon:yes stop_codon:yes gene_type:complete
MAHCQQQWNYNQGGASQLLAELHFARFDEFQLG